MLPVSLTRNIFLSQQMHAIQIDFNKMAINFLINITRQGQVVHVFKSSNHRVKVDIKKSIISLVSIFSNRFHLIYL
jgi:hypothetical protein